MIASAELRAEGVFCGCFQALRSVHALRLGKDEVVRDGDAWSEEAEDKGAGEGIIRELAEGCV